MSAKCFVDANVLIYAHDDSAGVKHEQALRIIEALWESGYGVLSTQVLQAVSYTHLDVYKRQAQARWPSVFIWKDSSAASRDKSFPNRSQPSLLLRTEYASISAFARNVYEQTEPRKPFGASNLL